MVILPPELFTAWPWSPVFPISALLVMETLLAMAIVLLDKPAPADVIFPLSVIAPQVPPVLLNCMPVTPVSNTAVPLPNCIWQAAPLALVLMALITS